MAEVYCRERYASSSILFLPIQWRRTLQVRAERGGRRCMPACVR